MKEKELRFLEPVEEDRWRHEGKRNEHVPPRSLTQRLCSKPPLVPRFGLDRPLPYYIQCSSQTDTYAPKKVKFEKEANMKEYHKQM